MDNLHEDVSRALERGRDAGKKIVARLSRKTYSEILVNLPWRLKVLTKEMRQELVDAIDARVGPWERRLAKVGKRLDQGAKAVRAFVRRR